MEVLARNAEHPRDFGLGFARRGDDVLAEHFARVRGAAVWVAAHFRLLVILLEVQHIDVPISELIGDAPRTIHMDGIARWIMATQGVIVEAGQVHVLRGGGGIKRIRAAQDARVKPRVDLSLARFR